MYARIVRSHCRHSAYQTILQTLMIALFVEMRHVFRERTTQGALPDENHLR